MFGLVAMIAVSPQPAVPEIAFIDVAKTAGLTHKTIYGGEHKNKYLLETTGCGVAWFDYDNDGCWTSSSSTARASKDFARKRRRRRGFTRTIATGASRM